MPHDFDRRNRVDPASRELSRALSRLSLRVPPPELATSLRVIASRERQRMITRRTFRQVCASWCERFSLVFDNVMRPLALPFAGGVFSAVVLFGVCVVPTFPLLTNGGLDVSTILTTEATVKSTAAMDVSGGDVVVDVDVDGQGRMVDYTIVSGAGVLKDAALRRRLENLLLFTQFVPATSFGQPTTGKVRLSVFSSSIDVKG